MQALAAPAQRVAAKPANRAGSRACVRVVCKATAQRSEVAKKAAVFASTLPAMIASSPAFALVDERLNGDGTGLPFGVNEGVLGWTIVGVFGLVWTLYFVSQKDLGAFEDPEDGLKL